MLLAVGLEYETAGNGAPVLFIHGGAICDADLPLMSQPALSSFKLVRYRRRGYGGSVRHKGHASFSAQASDAASLLRELGITRAHVVGHSYGGLIALQMALDSPGVVHSLALLEPALLVAVPPLQSAPGLPVAAAQHLAGGGSPAGAIDAMFQRVAGPNWRTDVSAMIPGASEQVDRDAGSTMPFESNPAELRFDADAAKRIDRPVLSVRGTRSMPRALEVRATLHSWLPQTEDLDIEGANHFVHFNTPASVALVAAGLADFFARHPLPSQ